jgi:uncharacterized protein (TIGR03066 family)
MTVSRIDAWRLSPWPLAIALALTTGLAGCWRDSPPEVQEFRPPVARVVADAPATQPATQPSAAVAEVPKPQEAPEVKPESAKAPATAVAASPSPEPVKESAKAPTIVGTWQMTKATRSGQQQEMPAGLEMRFTFNEDGTLAMSQSFQGQSHDMSGSYTLSGNQITMTMMDRTVTGSVVFNGDNEITLDIDNSQMTLARS